jgi:tetratricopeptide (TPR) repeat protein
MDTRWTKMVQLVIIAGLGTSLAGCNWYGMLNAKKSFKTANGLYQAADYEGAAVAYLETVADPAVFEEAPELVVAYFYLGNSYDNMYRPSRKGERENDALLDKAVNNYQLAADHIDDPQLRQLSMEYLVASYGIDKLNDPGQAEPIVRRMIELNPQETTNYFALAKLYEDSGLYDLAEETLVSARDMRPDDAAVYLQLAGYYNRQGEFEETMIALDERANREPNNPEAFYTISTYYWEKAFRDFNLTEEEKAQHVVDGLLAIDKALDLKGDYMEAMVYKNILLRMQANVTQNQEEQDALIAEADELRDRADEIRKERAAGAAG